MIVICLARMVGSLAVCCLFVFLFGILCFAGLCCVVWILVLVWVRFAGVWLILV